MVYILRDYIVELWEVAVYILQNSIMQNGYGIPKQESRKGSALHWNLEQGISVQSTSVADRHLEKCLLSILCRETGTACSVPRRSHTFVAIVATLVMWDSDESTFSNMPYSITLCSFVGFASSLVLCLRSWVGWASPQWKFLWNVALLEIQGNDWGSGLYMFPMGFDTPDRMPFCIHRDTTSTLCAYSHVDRVCI